MAKLNFIPHILIVDDEPLIIRMLTNFLEPFQSSIATASNGEEAIEIMNGGVFDLVITDYNMPQITGGELIAWIKEHKPETKTILITGYATLDKAIEVFRNGAFDFLMKPFKKQIIINTVQNALRTIEMEKIDQQHRDDIKNLYFEILTQEIEGKSILLKLFSEMFHSSEHLNNNFQTLKPQLPEDISEELKQTVSELEKNVSEIRASIKRLDTFIFNVKGTSSPNLGTTGGLLDTLT